MNKTQKISLYILGIFMFSMMVVATTRIGDLTSSTAGSLQVNGTLYSPIIGVNTLTPSHTFQVTGNGLITGALNITSNINGVSPTIFGYLTTISSDVQNQINAISGTPAYYTNASNGNTAYNWGNKYTNISLKAPLASPTFTGELRASAGKFTELNATNFTTTGTINGGSIIGTGGRFGTGVGSSAVLNIRSGTDVPALDIGLSSAATSDGVTINANSATTTGRSLLVYGNAYTSGNAVNIQNNNAAATGIVTSIKNDGTGNGLFIDQNGNGISLNIDSEATANAISIESQSTGEIVNINDRTQATGLFIGQYTADRTTAGKSLIYLEDSRAGTTQPTMYISNAGSGAGLVVDGAGIGYSAIFNNGKVGIGTTNPSVTLDIVSTSSSNGIKIKQVGSAQQIALLNLDGNRSDGGQVNHIKFDNNGVNTAYIVTTGNKEFYIFNNGTYPFYALGNGKVGIGTTTPSQTLTVAGTANITGNVFFNDKFNITASTGATAIGANVRAWNYSIGSGTCGLKQNSSSVYIGC